MYEVYSTGSTSEQAEYSGAEERDRAFLMRHTIDPTFVDSLGFTGAGRSVATVAASVAAEAVLAQRAGKASSYSRRHDWYGPGARQVGGRDFTHANVTQAVRLMEQGGFITTTMGVYRSKLRPNETGRQSTFSATPKLIHLADETPRILLRGTQTVILKDADKALMAYRDTRETNVVRRELREQTESVRPAQITMNAPDVTWTQNGLVAVPHIIQKGKRKGQPTTIYLNVSEDFAFYRVFNLGRFSQGGRCYGHYTQSLPKSRRLQILIDGQVVALSDFSASHPRMLYAKAGIPLDGDPYEISGVEREVGKVGLMIVLNAVSRRQGIEAMAGRLEEEFEVPAGECKEKAAAILEAMEARHAPIASAFYKGTGLACQRIEADILAAVAKQCRRENIVTLPVHDELISQERHAGRVRELMMSCWHTRLGVDPVVK